MRWPVLVLTLLITAVAASSAQASGYRSRAETWEFTVRMLGVAEQSWSTPGGTQVSTNSDIGWGFGFGYNFNNHLGLDFDISWNSPSYDANVVGNTGTWHQSGELETSTIHLNLIYNIFKGPITPYVSAGIGSTYVDTNIPSGPAGTTCWYDPWYGYICSGYQPTYASSRFSYSGAVGLRWDLSQSVFLRAAIGSIWLDMPNGGDQSFIHSRLEIGFSY